MPRPRQLLHRDTVQDACLRRGGGSTLHYVTAVSWQALIAPTEAVDVQSPAVTVRPLRRRRGHIPVALLQNGRGLCAPIAFLAAGAPLAKPEPAQRCVRQDWGPSRMVPVLASMRYSRRLLTV